MAAIPQLEQDPTLAAADQALADIENAKEKRSYLGMSSIGNECERKLWYDVHDPLRETFKPDTVKRFDDGHRSEDIMAARLRLAPGIELWTHDEDGKQFGCSDHDGKFRGHMDGVILGLYQAPTTPHVWEAKAVNEKKFAEFKRLKASLGEKATLAKWNPVYWAQAQCYMGYFNLTRHYITVSTPGVRDWDSARTEFDFVAFERLKNKAQRILSSRGPLAKIGNSASWFQCKFCVYKSRCHGEAE